MTDEEPQEPEVVTARRVVAMVWTHHRGDSDALMGLLREVGEGGEERVVASFIALFRLVDHLVATFDPDPDRFLEQLTLGVALHEALNEDLYQQPGEDST